MFEPLLWRRFLRYRWEPRRARRPRHVAACTCAWGHRRLSSSGASCRQVPASSGFQVSTASSAVHTYGFRDAGIVRRAHEPCGCRRAGCTTGVVGTSWKATGDRSTGTENASSPCLWADLKSVPTRTARRCSADALQKRRCPVLTKLARLLQWRRVMVDLRANRQISTMCHQQA